MEHLKTWTYLGNVLPLYCVIYPAMKLRLERRFPGNVSYYRNVQHPRYLKIIHWDAHLVHYYDALTDYYISDFSGTVTLETLRPIVRRLFGQSRTPA